MREDGRSRRRSRARALAASTASARTSTSRRACPGSMDSIASARANDSLAASGRIQTNSDGRSVQHAACGSSRVGITRPMPAVFADKAGPLASFDARPASTSALKSERISSCSRPSTAMLRNVARRMRRTQASPGCTNRSKVSIGRRPRPLQCVQGSQSHAPGARVRSRKSARPPRVRTPSPGVVSSSARLGHSPKAD